MLPIVRKHEYMIIECLLNGIADVVRIKEVLEQNIVNCKDEEIDHALKYMYDIER